jgi:hypothetical protein
MQVKEQESKVRLVEVGSCNVTYLLLGLSKITTTALSPSSGRTVDNSRLYTFVMESVANLVAGSLVLINKPQRSLQIYRGISK